MIKISKDGLVLEVSSGAYKTMYKAAGWSPVVETPAAAPQEPAVDFSGERGSNHTPEDHDGSEEPQWANMGEEEILNKMSDDELKQYASLLGIQTKDLKGRKKLMEAIKAPQK